ncbi:MAG TPA: glutathione transferase GstA [Haliangiales bacterium]|nr:glutathione transferase GstA [Haliangiales bacterium]
MTLTLFYRPAACSQSPHIVLRELGLPFALEKVDRQTGKLADGTEYAKINPKGYVPALRLDNGEILVEGPAIVQYLADQKPEAGLAPRWGTFERYRLIEWLNFLTSEIHKGYSPLFRPTTPEEYKTIARTNLGQRLAWVDGHLASKPFLMGERFTVADPYLFVMLSWSKGANVSLEGFPHLTAFRDRIAARPAVQEALRAEGLLQ